MRERLESQGGTLTVESAPGAGTAVVAVLPHPPARPATDEARTPGRASAKSRAR
jgi:signal transduction histidine kinase